MRFRTSLSRVAPAILLSGIPATGVFANAIPYSGGARTEDFDKLPTAGSVTLPGTGSFGVEASVPGLEGWQAARIGGSSASPLTMSATPETTGRMYSYGPAEVAERALGSLGSGTSVAGFGASYVNRSNQTFTRISVRYAREIWTVQGTGTSNSYENRLRFSHGFSGSGITPGNFINHPAMTPHPPLDAVSPASNTITGTTSGTIPDRHRDGNNAAWRETVESEIRDISWPPGGMMFLRWNGSDHSGFDAGLAVDDLEIRASTSPVPLQLTIRSPVANEVRVEFPSIPGRNYRIERSADLMDWELAPAINLSATGLAMVQQLPVSLPHEFFRAIDFGQSPEWQEVFFTRPGPTGEESDPTLEDKIEELLDLAPPGSSVRAAIYTWSRTRMAEAFIGAHLRGVDVRIIVGSQYAATELLEAVLPEGSVITCRNAGGMIAGCHGGPINHNKFVLFSHLTDGSGHAVVQSSANFTNPQLVNNNNLVVLRNDEKLHASYLGYWNDLSRAKPNLSYYREIAGDTGSRVYFFPRSGANGTTGANDTIVEQLTAIAPGPETRIRVAMAFWTEARRAIAHRLVALRREGCDVAVIVNPDETAEAIVQILEAGGVPVILLRPVHSKYLLIDGVHSGVRSQLVYTGSHNYTGAALTGNDETLLKLDNPLLHAAFLDDWGSMAAHPLAEH